ncbi:prestin-like isoform X2 [Amphiura filiformis]
MNTMEIGENDGQPPQLRQRITINRPAYSEEHFQRVYQESAKEDDSIPQLVKKKITRWSCTTGDAKKMIQGFFPILKWLPEYNVRGALLGDVMSGFTVGILRLPQGMAYGILATLAPVYGLYTVFFPALIYSLMGTCMHLSIGSFAVVSIMTGTAVEKGIKFAQEESTANNETDFNEEYERARIATTVAFLTGFIQIGLAVLRLGFISTYLALPLVRGFTTGAACYVFNSQFKSLFGIQISRYDGPFAIIKSIFEVLVNLHKTNPAELLISLSCIIVLVMVKEIQDKYLKKVKYPIPIELIVIIIGTAVSYGGKFEERFGVNTVGDIPTGLPSPIVPPVKYMSLVITDAFTIAIVTFSVAVSMGFIFGKRNNYEIDPNQELYAIGASNVFCSFFLCYPAASSLSRSLLQEIAGGTTQIAGTLSCMFILLVLLFMGPLFEPLPKSVLAAIVVVALRGMFRQFKDIKDQWKYSKLDCLIWIVTFSAVVLLGVDIGLGVGVAFAIYTVIVRTQHPQYNMLGKIPETDIYRDIQYYEMAQEIPHIKIFCAHSPIYYANADYIKETLYSKVGIHPLKVQVARAKARRKHAAKLKNKEKKWKKQSKNDEEAENVLQPKSSTSTIDKSKNNSSVPNDNSDNHHNDGKHHILVELDQTIDSSHNDTISTLADNNTDHQLDPNCSANNFHSNDNNHSNTPTGVSICNPNGKNETAVINGSVAILTEEVPEDNLVGIHTIILDLGGVSFVDVVGINTIKGLITDYQKIGVNVLLAQCRANIQHILFESGCIDVVGLDRMFLTLHDAVLYAEGQLQNGSCDATEAETSEAVDLNTQATHPSSFNDASSDNNSMSHVTSV